MSDPSKEVLDALRSIQQTQSSLLAAVESLSDRPLQASSGVAGDRVLDSPFVADGKRDDVPPTADSKALDQQNVSEDSPLQPPAVPGSPSQRPGFTSRIVLT